MLAVDVTDAGLANARSAAAAAPANSELPETGTAATVCCNGSEPNARGTGTRTARLPGAGPSPVAPSPRPRRQEHKPRTAPTRYSRSTSRRHGRTSSSSSLAAGSSVAKACWITGVNCVFSSASYLYSVGWKVKGWRPAAPVMIYLPSRRPHSIAKRTGNACLPQPARSGDRRGLQHWAESHGLVWSAEYRRCPVGERPARR